MTPAALIGLAWASPCEAPQDPDAALQVPPPPRADRVRVALVVRADGDDLEPAQRALATIAARGGAAALALSVGDEPPPQPVVQAVARARAAGHELVLHLDGERVSAHPERGPKRLRALLKPTQRELGRVRTLVSDLSNRQRQAVAHRVGVRTVVALDGAASALPTRLARLPARPQHGVVLPPGPYAGACGSTPIAEPLTPSAADRITQAMHGASTAPLGVVSVVLTPRTEDELSVLERWLDHIAPAGARLATPSAIRVEALALLDEAPAAPSHVAAAGRLVPIADVRAAATAIAAVDELPRLLPGGLDLTSAYLAFTLLLAERTEGDMIRLPPLRGPSQRTAPPATLAEAVPSEALVKLARALVDDLPAAIPAALRVDGALIPAPELLVLFACAVEGRVSCPVREVTVPEPNRVGLGWGGAD